MKYGYVQRDSDFIESRTVSTFKRVSTSGKRICKRDHQPFLTFEQNVEFRGCSFEPEKGRIVTSGLIF